MTFIRRQGRRLAVAVAIGAVVTLAGCAPSGGPSGGPETLELWVRAGNQAKTEALADAWNAENDVKVEVTAFPDSQFVTRIGTAAASGTCPTCSQRTSSTRRT